MKKTVSVMVLMALVTGCNQPYGASVSYRIGQGPAVVQIAPRATQYSYPAVYRTSSYQPYVPQKSAEEKANEEKFLNGILGLMGAAYAYGLKNMKEGKGAYYTGSTSKVDSWEEEQRKINCSSYVYSDHPWAKAYTDYYC